MKRIAKLLVVLLFICTIFVPVSCGKKEEKNTAPVLDEASALEIRTAYYEKHKDNAPETLTVDDITIGEYVWGDGWLSVVAINGVYEYENTPSEEVVHGVHFCYPTQQHLEVYVYSFGEFYTLLEAADKNYLQPMEVIYTHMAHRERYPKLYTKEKINTYTYELEERLKKDYFSFSEPCLTA